MLATGVAGLLSYVAVTLSARFLGPADFGLLGALVGIVSLLTVVLSPMASLATHFGASWLAQRRSRSVATLAGPALAAGTVLGFGAFVVVALLAAPLQEFLHADNALALLLLAPFAAALAWVQLFKGLLSGLQRFGAFAIATVIEPLVRAGAIVPLLSAYAVAGGLAAYLGGVLAAVVVSIVALGRPGWQLPGRGELTGPGRTAVASAVLTLIVALLQSGDVIVLRWYAEAIQAGLYAAAAALGNSMFTLVAPMMLPAFSRTLLSSERDEPTLPILLETLAPLVAIGVIAAAAAFWWGGAIGSLIFGDRFTGIGEVVGPYFVKTAVLLVLASVGQYAVAVVRLSGLVAAVVPACMGPLILLVFQPGPTIAPVVMTVAAFAALVVAGVPALRGGRLSTAATY